MCDFNLQTTITFLINKALSHAQYVVLHMLKIFIANKLDRPKLSPFKCVLCEIKNLAKSKKAFAVKKYSVMLIH